MGSLGAISIRRRTKSGCTLAYTCWKVSSSSLFESCVRKALHTLTPSSGGMRPESIISVMVFKVAVTR